MIEPSYDRASYGASHIHFKIIFGSDKSEPIHDSSRQDQGKNQSTMSHILGARLVPNEQVRIAPTEIGGIGPKEATQVRYRLGISENIKVNESTKYQIDQIERIIGQDHVVHWELKRGKRADIERFIPISCYRGIRHQDGLPLRGQRTHTNARTCRKFGIVPIGAKRKNDGDPSHANKYEGYQYFFPSN